MVDDVLREVLDDLAAEHDELDLLLQTLADADWDAPTPAEPFAVRDQVFHLAFGEELAALALSDPDEFGRRLAALLGELDTLEAASLARARGMAPAAILDWWREERERTLDGLRSLPDGARVPWITGPMRAASFAAARLMETWAHGQDVYDALGRTRPPSDRLHHIADLGVRTRGFAYRNRGLEPPATDVRVELEAPNGDAWRWGDAGATDRVTGTALDFCLLVTQRRHRADTELVATGAGAEEWLRIAQVFAGPPTDGRAPSTAVAR